MKEVILASNNKNKIREYSNILNKMNFKIISQEEAGINIEVDETRRNF